MKALIVYDTKHGSTALAAAALAEGLASRGVETDLAVLSVPPPPLGAYGLVVAGAPFYFGQWSKLAKAFLEAHARELEAKGLAVFALGMSPAEDEAALRAALPQSLASRAPKSAIFGGILDTAQLSFFERLITSLVAKASAKEGKSPVAFDPDAARGFGASLA